MATQARAVLKIPARIVGSGNISVTLQNGIYTISGIPEIDTIGINSQTGTSYTLTPDDNNKLITFSNPNAITVMVPTGLGRGFSCEIAQIGVGPVTVTGVGGATVNAVNDVTTLLGQYALAWLCAYDVDAFLLSTSGQSIPEIPVSWNRTTSFVGTGLMVVMSPISASATTSAGIYDSSGMLVRTLWNAEVNHPNRANPGAAWNGLLENGSVAPTGSYTAKVLAHNCTYTWEGVIGNTSPDHSTMNYWAEACPIVDMEIAADGKMWYTTQYHERLPTFGYSTTADPQHMLYGVPPTFRAAYENTLHVTTDGTIAYFARDLSGEMYVFGVVCATRAFASFPSGTGSLGGIDTIAYSNVNPLRWITSLAVQRTGNYLFIARPLGTTQLITAHKTSGATLQTNTSFVEPTLVETNPVDNSLWLCHKVSGAWRITKCAVDGSGNVTVTATHTTATIEEPRSMSISPDGGTLLLADGGTLQQIRAFNTSDGTVKSAFGTSGSFGTAGGYAASPDVTNTKWMFRNVSGFGGGNGWVAYAPDGSFWVGDSGNCRHIHFSSGVSPTYIEQVAYVPAFYGCAVCKNDPTRVFVGYQEYTINYGLPLAIGNGSWTLVRNWSYGLTDAAISNVYVKMNYVGTYSNGRTYASVPPPAGGDRVWYELTSTGLRSTGQLMSNASYVDADMNAYYTLWRGHGTWSRIAINPFVGFDGSNNPSWQYPTDWSGDFGIYLITADIPDGFPRLAQFDINIPMNHTEALSNNVIPFADPNGDSTGDRVGGIDATSGAIKFSAYPSQSNSNSGGVDQRLLLYPEAPFFARYNGIGVNAGGVFAYEPGGTTFFFGHIGEGGWGNNQDNYWAHYHESGLMLQRFGVAAPYFASTSLTRPDAYGDDIPNNTYSFKALDKMAGNAKWGGSAWVGGVMYLYQNDEWYHSGLHRWKVTGINSVEVQNHSISWNSSSYVPPAANPNNLLEGLPFNSTELPNGSAGWTRAPTTNILTDYFNGPYARIFTNAIRANPNADRDLCLQATLAAGTPCYVYKAIPRVGSGNWTIDAKIYWRPSLTDTHPKFEILDNTGKVIFTLHNYSILGGGPQGCKINGTDLMTPIAGEIKWRYTTEQEVVLLIVANVSGGTMSVTYAGTTVSRSVHEVGANLGSPARVQIMYQAPASGFGGADCAITRLRYSEA